MVQENENYDYDACDQLNCRNGIRFSYDMNGNMTENNDPAGGITRYVYNYQGRLMKIKFPDEAESRYVYNSDGMRLRKKDKTGAVTVYHWASGFSSVPEVLDETDADGNITATYFPYIGFKSIFNNNQWRFFITDHLGSVTALTDENGNITDQYDYDEYGVITGRTGTSWNTRFYTGQELDNDSGLIYLRARYYSPELGRFVTRDPIGRMGGKNFYVYVADNPVNYKDINGMHHAGVVFCGRYAINSADHIDSESVKAICCIKKELHSIASVVFDKVKHCVVACRFFSCLFKYNIFTFNVVGFQEAEFYTELFIYAYETPVFGGEGTHTLEARADMYAGRLGLRNAQINIQSDCIKDCCKERFYDDKMNLLPFLQ